MLVIVVSKGGRAPGSDVVMDTPKDLLVACCDTNHASLTKYRLIRPSNVNSTGAQLTSKSSSSPLSSTASYRISGDIDFGQSSNTIQSSV